MLTVEEALRKEIAKEVTHPVEEYAPGSARLERLERQLEELRRFSWPSIAEVNV